MEFDELKREWQIRLNWRAHVSEYVRLQTQLKRDGKSISPEQYCKQEGIDQRACKAWLAYVKMEDKFTFYRSFATEHLNRSQRSLELLDHYIDLDPRLRMPLIRDAIISYAALFCKSNGRVFTKWQLEAQTFVPTSLLETHEKICTDRDLIFAHCDLTARDPKVSRIGISLRGQGFYWDNYRSLLPQFNELIDAVRKKLDTYVEQENLKTIEGAFQDFLTPPPEALIDPGRPSSEGRQQ